MFTNLPRIKVNIINIKDGKLDEYTEKSEGLQMLSNDHGFHYDQIW